MQLRQRRRGWVVEAGEAVEFAVLAVKKREVLAIGHCLSYRDGEGGGSMREGSVLFPAVAKGPRRHHLPKTILDADLLAA